MSKQTAVEYLVEQLESIGFSINHLADYYNEVKIALEMEKEQMIDAILDNRNITSQVTLRDAEHYFNEIYGETKN